MQTHAERFRQMMQEWGLTQEELGQLCGLKRGTIGTIVNGKTVPDVEALARLKTARPSLSWDWLMFGAGPMTKDSPAPPMHVAKAALTLAAEPLPSYCAAPELATGLAAEAAELRAENKQLRDELRQVRKEAREDLIGQARTYNSVKQADAELITKLYAHIERQQNEIDEYRLVLGHRKPTAAERQAQEQAGSGAPRMKIIPLGARYRNTEPAEATECVVREMYPAAEVSLCEAA